MAVRHVLCVRMRSSVTSNSRPWRSIGSFMYIGSAGPGPGGRTDGRTVADGGRTGGHTEGRRADGRRADGRADGRPHGRADGGRAEGGRAAGMILNDSTTIFIDFHKKLEKNIVFFCRFASGGSASTDFYSSNEKGIQKT